MLLHRFNLAKNYTDITQDELDIILTYKESVQIDNDNSWVKAEADNFDVTMGSFDIVKIAELVGIYIFRYTRLNPKFK